MPLDCSTVHCITPGSTLILILKLGSATPMEAMCGVTAKDFWHSPKSRNPNAVIRHFEHAGFSTNYSMTRSQSNLRNEILFGHVVAGSPQRGINKFHFAILGKSGTFISKYKSGLHNS